MIPLGMAPPGQTASLVGGPSHAWMPRLAIYTTLPVAVVSLLLRICARLRMKVQLGVDDCEHRCTFPNQCHLADVSRPMHTLCCKCWPPFHQLICYAAVVQDIPIFLRATHLVRHVPSCLAASDFSTFISVQVVGFAAQCCQVVGLPSLLNISFPITEQRLSPG